MTNNDIIRRLRHTFDFSDSQMLKIFASTGVKVTHTQILDWMAREEDQDFVECPDIELARFLNGFINLKRGPRDPQPEPETMLSNNAILRKLKIALELRDDDMLEILRLANREISKHELSAFFRRPEHKHYRDCQDQILRNLLTGLQRKYRARDRYVS